MIGIIGAMQEEVDAFIKCMDEQEVVNILNIPFYHGFINDKEVVVVKCGIGKAASASIATLLIFNFKVTRIINIGICGGIVNKIHEKDFLIVNKCSYSDVDCMNGTYGRIQDLPLYFEADSTVNSLILRKYPECVLGNILTGDKFITDYSYIEGVMQKYQSRDFNGVDMESASIGQMCYTYGVKFNILRYISDVVGKEFQLDNYFTNKEDSSYVLIDIVKYLLEVL